MPPSQMPKTFGSSSDGVSMSSYGAADDTATHIEKQLDEQQQSSLTSPENLQHHQSSRNPICPTKDDANRVGFLGSHTQSATSGGEYSTIENSYHDSSSPLGLNLPADSSSSDTFPKSKVFFSHTNLRKLALDLSLWINIFILLAKAVAYLETLSLSILAALVDSILDVVSQWILSYTERRSSKDRSSAHYPAGASRLEPLGVLSCAALMGFASLGVLKEALEKLYEGVEHGGESGGGESSTGNLPIIDENWSSFWSMLSVVFVKMGLWAFCQHVGQLRVANAADGRRGEVAPAAPAYYADSTLEALALDHWNDCLSNAVAAIALYFTLSNERLWVLDPIGAIIISIYIIFSWYSTGKEQIEQLTGKAAPKGFIDELYEKANNFDPKMEVDVVRAYHFGPKFLVELEVVLPRDTLLFESHDLGMELQYEIESREEVERCFVHIDYKSRPYDEHVVSKVPELRERYRPYKQMNSAVSL